MNEENRCANCYHCRARIRLSRKLRAWWIDETSLGGLLTRRLLWNRPFINCAFGRWSTPARAWRTVLHGHWVRLWGARCDQYLPMADDTVPASGLDTATGSE